MDKVEQARTWLLLRRPFYGSLALQLLKWRRSESFPVAATDGTTVWTNPKGFDGRPLQERGFIVAHEVLHVIFDHCGAGARYQKSGLGPDGKPWNTMKALIATDIMVNFHLMQDGFEPPKDAIVPAAFPHLSVDFDTTWEEVYSKLELPSGSGGKGRGNAQGGGGFDEHLAPGEGGSDEEQAVSRELVLRAVAQALETAKRAGNAPAFGDRLIERLARPRFSLKDALVEELLARGRGADWSFKRPKRQKLCLTPGLIMPSMISQSAGKVVIGIDVSGSIDVHTLNYFASVLDAALNEVSFDELWVVTIECDVTGGQRVQDTGELWQFFQRVKGGGGTYMPAVFPWIDSQGICPTQVVILTDGYTDFGDPPSYPVTWCITSDVKSPWGRTLKVEVEA